MKYFLTIPIILCFLFVASCNLQSKKQIEKSNEQVQIDSANSHIYHPILISNQLSEKVNEQSGLVSYQELFWVNNDSDCESSLYAYNKAGELKKELVVSNYKNIDWEDLTDDKDYIFVIKEIKHTSEYYI